MWDVARDKYKKVLAAEKSGMHIHCAFCGHSSEPHVMSALVSMRYGHTSDTCVVFLVDSLPLGACKTFFESNDRGQ